MNNHLDHTPQKPFPSIKQCFIIVGIITLCSIIFTPITIISASSENEFIKGFPFFLYYLTAFGVASFLVFLYKKRKDGQSYTHPQFKINNLILIPLVIITAIALQIGVTTPIISLIPMPESFKEIFESMNKNMTGFWGISAIIILAPILEEYIFRGVVLDGLLKKFSPIKAVLISSLFFGFIHFNPWQLITAMVIGIFAGWIYYKTKNLLLCIIIHFANNAWAILGIYIIPNSDAIDSYSTNKALFIIPALILASASIYILKIKLDYEQNKDSTPESIE